MKPRRIIDNGKTVLVPLTRGAVAVIDLQDAELVGQFNWHLAWSKSSSGMKIFYARRNKKSGNRYTPEYLHCFIMGRESVDHVDILRDFIETPFLSASDLGKWIRDRGR